MNHDEAAREIIEAIFADDPRKTVDIIVAKLRELGAFPEVPKDLDAAVHECVLGLANNGFITDAESLDIENSLDGHDVIVKRKIIEAVAPLLVERDERIEESPDEIEVDDIVDQIRELMKTKKWKEAFERSNRDVEATLEKLHKDSKVDPKLLDEPADI